MAGDTDLRDPFREVATFLVEIGKLDQQDANIYALGLRNFVITTSDVVKAKLASRQNSAGGRLQNLSRLGFFQSTPQDSHRKNMPKKFRAIRPSVALQSIFASVNQLKESLAMIDEHYENPEKAINPQDLEELWLTQSEDASISEAARTIRTATKSLKICSNDCTWIRAPEIEDALKYASKKAEIVVVANPDQDAAVMLKGIGVKLFLRKETGIPFCIVDDKILMMVSQFGGARPRNFLTSTKQEYMVKKQLALFKDFSRHSRGKTTR